MKCYVLIRNEYFCDHNSSPDDVTNSNDILGVFLEKGQVLNHLQKLQKKIEQAFEDIKQGIVPPVYDIDGEELSSYLDDEGDWDFTEEGIVRFGVSLVGQVDHILTWYFEEHEILEDPSFR